MTGGTIQTARKRKQSNSQQQQQQQQQATTTTTTPTTPTTPDTNVVKNKNNNIKNTSSNSNNKSSGSTKCLTNNDHNNKKKKDDDSNNKYNKFIIPGILLFVVLLLMLTTMSWNDNNNNNVDHDRHHHRNNNVEVNTNHNKNNTTKSNATKTTKKKKMTIMGTYELLETIRHDTSAFTQGLVLLHNDNDHNTNSSNYLIESTGMNGESKVRIIDVKNNGNVIHDYSLSNEYFGEGLTSYIHYYNDDENNNNKKMEYRLIQLTWQDQIAFIYQMNSSSHSISKQQQQSRQLDNNTINNPIISLYNISYNTTTNEGWGITYRNDIHIFYISDGSDYIHIWNANTLTEILPRVKITMQQQQNQKIVPIQYINELEWDPITQTILANIWYQDYIIRIEPNTGHVTNIYDLTSLYKNRIQKADCLNGIALSSLTNHDNEIWVTGKYWPKMYRIRLIDDPTTTMIQKNKTKPIL